MDKFRVGQKIGFVQPPDSTSPTGRWALSQLLRRTGVVTGPAYRDRTFPNVIRYTALVGGTSYEPVEEAMVPLYDGDEPASWETCAWRPRELSNVPA